jgi:hypothetical protein
VEEGVELLPVVSLLDGDVCTDLSFVPTVEFQIMLVTEETAPGLLGRGLLLLNVGKAGGCRPLINTTPLLN